MFWVYRGVAIILLKRFVLLLEHKAVGMRLRDVVLQVSLLLKSSVAKVALQILGVNVFPSLKNLTHLKRTFSCVTQHVHS